MKEVEKNKKQLDPIIAAAREFIGDSVFELRGPGLTTRATASDQRPWIETFWISRFGATCKGLVRNMFGFDWDLTSPLERSFDARLERLAVDRAALLATCLSNQVMADDPSAHGIAWLHLQVVDTAHPWQPRPATSVVAGQIQLRDAMRSLRREDWDTNRIRPVNWLICRIRILDLLGSGGMVPATLNAPYLSPVLS